MLARTILKGMLITMANHFCKPTHHQLWHTPSTIVCQPELTTYVHTHTYTHTHIHTHTHTHTHTRTHKQTHTRNHSLQYSCSYVKEVHRNRMYCMMPQRVDWFSASMVVSAPKPQAYPASTLPARPYDWNHYYCSFSLLSNNCVLN